jgi:RecA/RadA recombinase
MALKAEPILASTLLSVVNSLSKFKKGNRLKTACSPIDDALCGGIDYGHITLISGEKGTGKTTVCDVVSEALFPFA